MVGVVGGTRPALPPADDRDPDTAPGAAPVGTLMVQDIGGRRWAERRERAAEERRVTLALREAILPEPGASIDLPYARIAVRYVPAGLASSLGGDWYDAAPLPDGRMFLAVGDVSGHGLPAIAEMAQLRHALLGLSMTGACPGMLLTWLNTLVLTRLDDTTATAVCGHFDPATRLFTWAQAGHPAPILVRRGGARQLGAPRGVVLGATSSLPYGVADVRLEPGDLLLMFTDGLVERRSRDIGAGVSLIVEAAVATGLGSAGADLDGGLDRLLEAIGGPNPEDDTCLLAVAVTGEGPRHP
ncbi:serine/threonine-protein phosphatase [Microbispora sp. NEAU-D428]|nr:serine/threonine-protein phosphatase [Microbispora sitophila]